MEIWKDIKGYENIYQVSNFGNVRRWRKKAKVWFYLKPIKHSGGYRRLKLRDSGRDKDVYVHRLVAEAFLNGIGDQVNHKDRDKTNNHYLNLEWCTGLENVSHAFKGLGTSKYVGVRFVESRNKYSSRIMSQGKRITIGHFNCETKAYIERIKRLKELNINNKYA